MCMSTDPSDEPLGMSNNSFDPSPIKAFPLGPQSGSHQGPGVGLTLNPCHWYFQPLLVSKVLSKRAALRPRIPIPLPVHLKQAAAKRGMPGAVPSGPGAGNKRRVWLLFMVMAQSPDC